jgi:predicted dehydrogenase
MNNINVGIIGCGYWGPNLIRNFVELPDANVVAVADLRQERLDHIKGRYPHITVTRNYRDFFEMPIDAVAIATPPATHFAIARDCLVHNLHILIEKPITLNHDDAQELIDLAEARGLTTIVGHTFLYNPAVQVLKELIDSGELGQVYYIDAVRVNLGLYQSDLNVLWDLAPHDISILCYLLDGVPTSVAAQGTASIFHGKHDVAYLSLRFPDNVLAHVHVSWLDPCKVRRITVVGSHKMVVYDDVEPMEKIRIYDKSVEPPAYTDTYAEFHCSYHYGDVVIPNIRFTEPLRLECQEFLNCISDRTTGHSCGRFGLEVVRVLEAAERSLQNGGVQETIWFEDGVRLAHDGTGQREVA